MKKLFNILLFLLLLPGPAVIAQQNTVNGKNSVQTSSQEKKSTKKDSAIKKNTAAKGNEVKKEGKELKNDLKKDLQSTNPDSTKRAEIKMSTAQQSEKKLEEKVTNLEYNSEDPENAPWKKKQLSKDDLKDFNLPSEKNASDKGEQYKDRITNLKPGSEKKSGSPAALEKFKNKADSLLEAKERIESSGLTGSGKVYSERYKRKIYDSLGVTKGDSLLQLASALAKTETPKEELLNRINNPVQEKSQKAGLGFDEKSQSLNSKDAEELNGLNDKIEKRDISALQLPAETLAELPPLSGNLLNSDYLRTIDSMRGVGLKAKGYYMDQSQLTEDLKRTSLEKKPTFMDKSYFEMIIGFISDSSFTIVQLSPSWAYHFTSHLSAGIGPNIAVEFQDKKINGLVGLRTYVKAEVYKQRAYLQIEDNAGQMRVNKDEIRTNAHSILVGGGGILPLTKKIALNLAVFYRVNQQQVNPGGSPWVFRIGLSSMKKIAPK